MSHKMLNKKIFCSCFSVIFVGVIELVSQTCSLGLTIVTRVNSLSQQEAAELVLSMYRVLDLHQVGRHAEWIVLQITLTLLATAEN